MKRIQFIIESLANEYAEQYMEGHGGSFTKEELIDGFKAGFNGKNPPERYQAFLAWQAGKRHAGR